METLKILYVYHDCFVVKSGKAVLVFDFWKDPYQKGPLPNTLMNIDPSSPIYVFVSHGHKDHYNKEIFDWSRYFPNIRYIVSRDVRNRINHILSPESSYKGAKVEASRVIVLDPGEEYGDELVKVSAYSSTDIGCSYSVKTGEFSLFHAGDLNAWLWIDESTEEEVDDALSQFTSVLDDIAEKEKCFDICFFPVDSRIGRDYFTGAKMILSRIPISNFFPMHFELGENPAEVARLHRDAAAFQLYASPECSHYIMSAPYSGYFITK